MSDNFDEENFMCTCGHSQDQHYGEMGYCRNDDCECGEYVPDKSAPVVAGAEHEMDET